MSTPLAIFVVLDGILLVAAMLWFHARLPPRVQAAFDRVLTSDDDPPAEPQTVSTADHEAIQRMRDRWAKEAQS